jgi:prophage antirepressor-like protein
MKNQMQIFENTEFGKIRVIEIDGQPWFVGKDVTGALAYSNGSRDINRHVDPEDRQNYRNGTLETSNRGVTIINESGLYSLILSSKLPSAKRFKRWVTSEVLPSIRKHGAYIIDEILEEAAKNQNAAIELLGKLLAERDKTAALTELTETLAPKALYCDLILQCRNVVPVSLIAKDYGMTAVSFNTLLHNLGIQYKTGGAWLLYQVHAGKGYTKSRTYVVSETVSATHTYWTQKGRLFLYEKLKSCGIVPLLEACRMTA